MPGEVLRISSDGDDRIGAKIKTQKNPGPKISHHKSWDCFEYRKKSLLKSSHPIQYFPNFPTPNIPKLQISKPKIFFDHPRHFKSGVQSPRAFPNISLSPRHFLSSCKTQLNSLSPNSDQQQLSPNNVHTLSRDKVVRNIKNDHERENASMFY